MAPAASGRPSMGPGPSHAAGAAKGKSPGSAVGSGPGAGAGAASPPNPSDLSLPRLSTLAEQGYTIEPSLRQLAQLAAKEGVAALGSVRDFTLLRRGVGSLRWLEPVDVRGLDLEAIAHIEQGG